MKKELRCIVCKKEIIQKNLYKADVELAVITGTQGNLAHFMCILYLDVNDVDEYIMKYLHKEVIRKLRL